MFELIITPWKDLYMMQKKYVKKMRKSKNVKAKKKIKNIKDKEVSHP